MRSKKQSSKLVQEVLSHPKPRPTLLDTSCSLVLPGGRQVLALCVWPTCLTVAEFKNVWLKSIYSSRREQGRQSQDRPFPPASCFLKGSRPLFHPTVAGKGKGGVPSLFLSHSQYSCACSRVACAFHTAKTYLRFSVWGLAG